MLAFATLYVKKKFFVSFFPAEVIFCLPNMTEWFRTWEAYCIRRSSSSSLVLVVICRHRVLNSNVRKKKVKDQTLSTKKTKSGKIFLMLVFLPPMVFRFASPTSMPLKIPKHALQLIIPDVCKAQCKVLN